MDEREEGEYSEPEEIAYVPLARPDSSKYRQAAATVVSSEEENESEDDYDSDGPCLPKKRKADFRKMDTDEMAPSHLEPQRTIVNGNGLPKHKRNNIWANVLGEQVLSEEINIVGLKKIKGDRNVENYDFQAAQDIKRQEEEAALDAELEDGEINEEPEEAREIIQKRLSRKRSIHNRIGDTGGAKKRILVDIKLDMEWSDEELGKVIADALFEQKPELIVRVIEVLGKETALKLYNDTKDMEEDGGMMTVDGHRRRTSGGVFLQLVKKFPDLTPEQTQAIFIPVDKSDQQWRKRKRVPRKRVRHDSKPQNNKTENESIMEDHLSDSAGVKCPGSTPVTTPQLSDNEHSNPPIILEAETLQESDLAAKIEAKIQTREERILPSYEDADFGFGIAAEEMEIF